MDRIIRDIYRGRFEVFGRGRTNSPEHDKVLERLVQLEKELESALSPKQLEQFRAYSDAAADLSSLTCEEEFVIGYQLGVKLTLAAFPGEEEAK